MIYIDTNIFLFPVLNEEKDVPLARASARVLEMIVDGDAEASTSFLTWDEFFWIIKKKRDAKTACEESAKFLQFPNLKFVAADGPVIHAAQKCAEKYSLNQRDAIHMASALHSGASEIISDDTHFDNIKGIKRIPPEDFVKPHKKNV